MKSVTRNFTVIVLGLVFSTSAFAATVKCDFNGNEISFVASKTRTSTYAQQVGQYEITISTSPQGMFYLAVTDWSEANQIKSGVPDTVSSSFGVSKIAHISSRNGTLSCAINN